MCKGFFCLFLLLILIFFIFFISWRQYAKQKKGFFKILNLVSRLSKVGVISRKMVMPGGRAGTVITRKLSSFPTYSVVNGERALQLS